MKKICLNGIILYNKFIGVEMKSKICKIIACIALIASLIATGYGVTACYFLNVMNKGTIIYSKIPEINNSGNMVFQQMFLYPSARFMGCKTKKDVMKILSKDIESYLNFSMNTFIMSGIFAFIAFLSLIVDFFIKKQPTVKINE